MSTRKELMVKVATACMERAKTLGWRGEKTKTDNALNYLCGAAAAFHAVDHEDTDALTMMAFMVSVRGWSEVERFAAEKVED